MSQYKQQQQQNNQQQLKRITFPMKLLMMELAHIGQMTCWVVIVTENYNPWASKNPVIQTLFIIKVRS